MSNDLLDYRTIGVFMRGHERALSKVDVSDTELKMLLTIREYRSYYQRGVSPKDLAEVLKVTRTQTQIVLKRLRDKELVNRIQYRNRIDVYYNLTNEGFKMISEYKKHLNKSLIR